VQRRSSCADNNGVRDRSIFLFLRSWHEYGDDGDQIEGTGSSRPGLWRSAGGDDSMPESLEYGAITDILLEKCVGPCWRCSLSRSLAVWIRRRSNCNHKPLVRAYYSALKSCNSIEQTSGPACRIRASWLSTVSPDLRGLERRRSQTD